MKFQAETFDPTGEQKAEISVELNNNEVRIYVCDRWVCQSIDLTKKNVNELIAVLNKMKEAMDD